MDMETVISDLRYLKSFGQVSNNLQITGIAENAIAMLKEQEETINDLTYTIRQLNQHIKDLSEYMTPYGIVKDVKAYCELLKEHEAKKVNISQVHCGMKYGLCPKCGGHVDTLVNPDYCGYCGQELKWE